MWLLLPAVLLVLLPAVLLVLLPAVLRSAANAHGERVLLVPAAGACCVITDDIVVSANAAVIAMTASRANVILFIFSQIERKYKKKFFRNFGKSCLARYFLLSPLPPPLVIHCILADPPPASYNVKQINVTINKVEGRPY